MPDAVIARRETLVFWLNTVAALGALALTVLAAVQGQASEPGSTARQAAESAGDTPVRLPDGRLGLIDATGTTVPLVRFERIVGASVLADRLLLELCEPDRIAAFTRRSARRAPEAYRYSGKPTIRGIDDIEAVLELDPDLVLIHSVGNPTRIRKLREAGVTVFDLGQMLGLETLLPNAKTVGILVGHPERGRRLARQIRQGMARMAADVAPDARRGALYVGMHGDKLYGGTRGSSFHDVLTAAGLRDVAAERYEGWPKYTIAELLDLDPEVVVTQAGMDTTLCRHSELHRLRACSTGRVVAVDPALIADPGPPMLDAAERIHAAVYGSGEQP